MIRKRAEQNLFKPVRSRTETRSDLTNHTARAIIKAEDEQRRAKTAKLRKARLANYTDIAVA